MAVSRTIRFDKTVGIASYHGDGAFSRPAYLKGTYAYPGRRGSPDHDSVAILQVFEFALTHATSVGRALGTVSVPHEFLRIQHGRPFIVFHPTTDVA